MDVLTCIDTITNTRHFIILYPMNSTNLKETPIVTTNTPASVWYVYLLLLLFFLYGIIHNKSPQNNKIKWWSGAPHFLINITMSLCIVQRKREKCIIFLNWNIYNLKGTKSNQFHQFNSLTTHFESRIWHIEHSWATYFYNIIYHYHKCRSVTNTDPLSTSSPPSPPETENKHCTYTPKKKSPYQTWTISLTM